MVSSRGCRAKRVRLARIGLSASALAAMAFPFKIVTPAEAKTPGSTYCYHGTCHRVKTIEETQALVGVEEAIVASHYDDCKNDQYNPCGLTSSGERFHADRPDNTASPIYPDGTTLLVWSPETERALVVRVNNAGPYWGNRKLDLSRAAAERLGFEKSGVANVRVRVIKAPEPEEAKYVENRAYRPMPGDIGEYASLQAAQTGMAVALALQASAASPLAPVTTANAFAMAGGSSELLVAEAPQALGRGRVSLASFEMSSTVTSPVFGTLLTQSLKLSHASTQSRRRIAALSMDRTANQSVWGEDLLEAERGDMDTDDEARIVVPDRPQGTVVAKAEPAPEIKSEQKAETGSVENEPKAEAKSATKSETKHAARREKKKDAASRSRKQLARNEDRSRATRTASSGRRSDRVRVAYSEQASPRRSMYRGRSAEQITSLGIRAQAM